MIKVLFKPNNLKKRTIKIYNTYYKITSHIMFNSIIIKNVISYTIVKK